MPILESLILAAVGATALGGALASFAALVAAPSRGPGAVGATAAVLLSLAFADCALSRALEVAGGAP